ncbi:MAG: hypothetical protein U9Q03_04360 [Patescibacteria group bacterium]|nr:hypothetical protein [Patescibacteria group bacterium]
MEENEPQIGQSKALVTWEVDESKRYEKGLGWYLGAIVIGGGLLIYAVISANFLFALIILMVALVIYMTSLRGPDKVSVSVSEDGVEIGGSFYPFREMNRFWFIYDPPAVKSLYLDFKSAMRPRIALPLEDQNPNDVRAILSKYLHEDITEDDEPFSDYLGRLLKL